MSQSRAIGPSWSNRKEYVSTTSTTWTAGCCGTWGRHGCGTRKPRLTLLPAQRVWMPSRCWPMPASRGAPRQTVFCESSMPANAYAVGGGCAQFWSTLPKELAQFSNTDTAIASSERMACLGPSGRPAPSPRPAWSIATANTRNGSLSNSTAACFTTRHAHGTKISSATSMPRSMAGQPSGSPINRCSTDRVRLPPRSLR